MSMTKGQCFPQPIALSNTFHMMKLCCLLLLQSSRDMVAAHWHQGCEMTLLGKDAKITTNKVINLLAKGPRFATNRMDLYRINLFALDVHNSWLRSNHPVLLPKAYLNIGCFRKSNQSMSSSIQAPLSLTKENPAIARRNPWDDRSWHSTQHVPSIKSQTSVGNSALTVGWTKSWNWFFSLVICVDSADATDSALASGKRAPTDLYNAAFQLIVEHRRSIRKPASGQGSSGDWRLSRSDSQNSWADSWGFGGRWISFSIHDKRISRTRSCRSA